MRRASRAFDGGSLVVLWLAVLATIRLRGELPLRIATHFDLAGRPNGWMDRDVGIWIAPVATVVTFAVLRFAHVWLPPQWRERMRQSPVAAAAFTMVTLLGAVQALLLWAALHPGASMGQPLALMLGVFLLLQALVMPRLKRNPIMGIRVAWTLTSDENWARTHRFAAITFAVGGVVAIAGAVVGGAAAGAIAILGLLVGVTAPLAYSYVYAYREG